MLLNMMRIISCEIYFSHIDKRLAVFILSD